MIDLSIDSNTRKQNAAYCKSKGIKLPTIAMMKNPDLIPDDIKDKLKNTGLWDLDPVNLFRITWKNEPVENGGLYGKVNHILLPSELTGTKAKIIALTGKWFPTGAHKVGATFGCLAPRLVTGQFNPQKQKQSGLQQVTTAGAEHIYQVCLPAKLLRFFRRRCRRKDLNG